jgi:hypothetical protein
MNTKTEVFSEQTPHERFWARTETIVCALIAAVVATLTVLGVFDSLIVT